MSCPFFFVSRRPKSGTSQVQLQTDLYDCLKNISDQIKKDGVYVPEVLRPLVRCVIVETAVGPSHIAFRLQDGRVCRLSYSLRADKLVCVNERKRGRSSDSRTEFSYSRGSNAGSVRVPNAPVALRTLRAPMSVLGRGSRSMSLFREMQRQGLYLRPLSSQISPADVPENLIEQCQMVLQGKSRQLIIRELQRTNLDVNMAVNNMLSREDEADFNGASGAVNIGDEWEDDAEDIFSLLDHPEGLLLEGEGGFQEDIIDRSSSPRFRREILMDCDRTLGDHATYTDRRKRRRFDTPGLLRNSETYGGRTAESRLFLRNMGLPDEKEEESGCETVSGSTKCVESNVQLGDHLEFWPTNSAESVGSHFVSIAALYTELVAINSRGELHQWKWQSPEPFSPHGINSPPFNLIEQPETDASPVNHRHPRSTSLGITHEKVVSLSGCVTRASIMTASGAIATWMDEMLPSLFHSAAPASSAAATGATAALMRLEHPAIHFNELKAEVVIRISTAPLITVVQCASGAVFWWGVLPSYIRQRNVEKQRHPGSASAAPTTTTSTTSASASRHRSTSGSSEAGSKTPAAATTVNTCAPPLSPGDLVCMRNAPMFHAGAIGFTLINGVPKVGVLLEDAWKLTDVCRFRVKSPSALRSQTGVVVMVTGGSTVAGKSSSTEAVHALTCPYVQAAAAAAAAAAQTDHEPPPTDSGAMEMPPPPSPASSTCSDHSGPVKVSPRAFKRKKAPSTSSDGSGNGGGASGSSTRRGSDQLDQQQQQLTKQTTKPTTLKPQHDEEIEDWCLSEVIFVEDGRTQPVGVLLKIDGTIAAVKFLKEQDRACLAARCPSAPVCLFINHITKTAHTLQKSFVAPPTTSSPSLVAPHDPMAWLNDCRLLKKDDLMQVKQSVGGGLSQRVPDFVQATPRHISMNFLTTKSNSMPSNISKKRIFALAPENSRLHAIVGRVETEIAIGSGEDQRMRHLEYHVFTLNGKTVSSRRLPALSKSTGAPDNAIDTDGAKSSLYSDIMLTCPAERPLLLRDSAGVVFPFLPPSRPGQESWVFPPWLDLPAVQCAALSWISASPPRTTPATTLTPASQRDTETTTTSSTSRASGENSKKLTLASAAARDLQGDPRLLLGVVVVRETSLLQHILRADEAKVEEALRLLSTAPPSRVELVASEMADGHRTILHVAVLMCAPMARETPEMAEHLENILKRTGSGSSGSTSAPPPQPPPPPSDGSGWTTISPSPPPPPPPPLPRSLHSLLNLSASSNQRLSNAGAASSAATASSSTSSVHDLFIRSPLEAAAASVVEAAAAVSVAVASSSSTSSGGHFCHMAPLPATEEASRRVASHRILRALILHPRLRTLLPHLLSCLSDDGLTPFMLAIQCKAYQVAVFLLDFLAELEGIRSDGSEESAHQFRYSRLMRYLFPPSARLDDSPLFTLCYNDTCSFTWTGPNHIRQDIFECRTCGLMDSLCCCSECARVCHKGHDCRLKRTSPTAYCDCWEKCRCRSLVLGHQASRLFLFQRLLLHTDLVYLPNRANEHLLVYLTRCVERQTREQKQYKSARRRGGSGSGGGNGGGGSGGGGGERGTLAGARASGSTLDEPEHDLEPPTFSRDALELVLDSKAAAASLLCDCKNVVATESFAKFGDRKGKSGACQSVMAIQSGTSQLDDFVFTLLCKCPAEFVQRFINTLARSLSDHLSGDRGVHRLLTLSLPSVTGSSAESTDAYFYCQRGIARFVRSVARVYTGLMLELSPDHHRKKPRLVTQAQPLELARFVFFQLAPVALPELAFLAVKVIAPVRIGALRSTATFNLTSQQGEAIHGFDQVLAAERSLFSRSRQSQSSTCASSVNGFFGLGNALDCPNSTIRSLLYGCGSTGSAASTLLPTWKVSERRHPPASPPKTEQQQRKPLQSSERGKSCVSTDIIPYSVEEPMDIDSTSQEPAPGSSNHMKRHRHRSQSSGGGGDHQSPPSKHRRRHRHHGRRHRNHDTIDPASQPPQPPVIVVESSVATTNSTTSTNPFAEMELLPAASGDSDTDADIRSNELDSNATTAAAASTHTVEEGEEDFSDTASEEDEDVAADSEVETHSITSSTGGGGGGGGGDGGGVERSLLLHQNPQIEASGSQHSSISSTAATAGTTGSVIMDMDASVAGGSLGTVSGAVGSASSQQEFIASYPPERDQQPPPGGNNTMDDDTVVVTMFCGSDEEEEEEEGDENELDETLPISEMGLEEDLDHGTRRRNQRDDVSEVEDDDEDDEDEEIEDDEEVGVEEEEEEEDDSEDDGGESEDDEDDDVGEEEEEEDDDETEEEEEVAHEHGAEGEEEEEEEDAYSQESEPSPPPSSPFSPWSRHPSGSSNAPAPTTSAEDAAPTTSTSTTATTAASRNFPTSSSTLARLYSAALSSAFDQRTGHNTSLASRNALARLNLLTAPLSPPRTNSNNANTGSPTVTTNVLSGVTPTVSSAPIVSITEPASNNDTSEAKKHGIHVTQVQLSRAFACLLRLLADVMADLVNRGNEGVDTEEGIGETEGSATTGSHTGNSDMRRCVSAPVFVHSSLDLPLLRKLRVFSRKGNGYCLAPLRSLVAARPTDSMDQALICTAVGFVLAPVWAWLTEALDGLESRLRARAAWNAQHPNAGSVEVSALDSGTSGRRKEGKSDRTGSGGRSSSQHQQSAAENTASNAVGSSSNATGGAGTSAGTGHTATTGAVTTGGGEVGTGGGGSGGRNSSNRQQLLSYLLSLMRTANNDHGVVVPPVDVYSYKHTAYLVDSFLYFFKVFESTWPSGLMHHLIHLNDFDANAKERMEVGEEGEEEPGPNVPVAAAGLTGGPSDTDNVVGLFQGHPLAQCSDAFFRRSASTLSLVGVGVDPVLAPASEAMPLAFTPQQLHPNSRRSELFGTVRGLDSDFLSSSACPEDKVSCHENEADVKALHYSRIGRSFKDSKMGTQIAWGGEFLDTACHTGSVLTRWCRSLEAFSQAFAEDVGSEHRSYMLELARFPDKEARFRKEMERLRNATRRDLTLEVEREPNALIISTVRQLNTEFSRRLSQTSTITQMLIMRDSFPSRYSDLHLPDAAASQQPSPNLSAAASPILSCRRLKVTFKDEPGEGSGVARSFITAFSEAVLSNIALPDLSPLFASVNGAHSAPSALDPFQPRSSSLLMAATSRLLTRLRLPYSSQVTSAQQPPPATSTTTTSVLTPTVSTRLRRGDLHAVGPASRALFRNPVTSSISINLSSSSSANTTAASAPNASVEREDEERERMEDRNIGPELATSPSTSRESVKTSGEVPTTTAETVGSGGGAVERAPLFWQPGITGFYSPRGIGSNLPPDSPELLCRLSLYRCVGRVIGLCLLFNETCPLRFNRHVLKYILGRPLCWHDFAFYNTTVYEGLRQLLLYTTTERSEGASDSIRDYSLTFSLIMAPEEGGSAGSDGSSSTPQQHLLVPGGDEIEVDSEKIYEFVKRYTEFKMVEAVKEPLEQIRLGVFDVLPANALDGLTAEDLRLLLNGIWDVDVDLLASYTTFLDESNCGAAAAAAAAEGGVQSEGATETTTTASAANERVARLKRWFWHIVRSLDSRQRQDLLYFWTSSPALPASAQGFAPMPTIMIRPADDQHLPTANTCISRLYLPLYSSKHILREKLLQAIETRSFGFV